MGGKLDNKRIAILATEGFEYVELKEPLEALEKAGAKPEIVSQKAGKIRGWNYTDWVESVAVDTTLDRANPDHYDALLLPGGVMNPDHLRMDPKAVRFVQAFFRSHKPVAAICHGPWLLVEADVVRGRRLTSWPSLQTDIRNAGGNWVDEEVVVDQGLVTSRKPADIPAFNRKMIEEFAEGKHMVQHA